MAGVSSVYSKKSKFQTIIKKNIFSDFFFPKNQKFFGNLEKMGLSTHTQNIPSKFL